MEQIQFEYFRGMEAEQYSFYRVPKVLFTAECFKELSCEAKVLYGLMLDRIQDKKIRNGGMRMGWTMEQLFREGIMPREMCCPKKQEYKDTMHLLDELESDMKKQFTEEQAELLENYKEYFSLLATLENEECFIQGMALGTRLTVEAFLTRKDKTE